MKKNNVNYIDKLVSCFNINSFLNNVITYSVLAINSSAIKCRAAFCMNIHTYSLSTITTIKESYTVFICAMHMIVCEVKQILVFRLP